MKLLLADDHTLFRDALCMYIERAEPQSTVKIAHDLHGAFDVMESGEDFDVVLLDLGMPGMNGLEGLRKMRAAYPDARIAIISGTAQKNHIHTALEMGAVAYFSKTMPGQAMISAIKLVVGGEKYVAMDHAGNELTSPNYNSDQAASKRALPPVEKNIPSVITRPDGGEVRFTPRERDVLVYLTHGASNKEIARALNLQVVTVKLHVRGICRKLDARNRTQAALLARAMGLAGEKPADLPDAAGAA